MLIASVRHPKAPTLTPEDVLSHAAEEMWGHRVGSALVEDDGGPGIITERDLLRSMAQGADPATTKVREYMTPNAVSITPAWEVMDAARMMVERGFRHLLVVEDDGSVEGIISMRDMIIALVEERQRMAAG